MATARKRAKKVERWRTPWWTIGLAAFAVGGIALVAVFFSLPETESWGLPAVPRNPRPATLNPELFIGKVRNAYRIARQVPELLERMPCYCGCYVNNGHRNNLDCYVDRHAAG